MSNYQEETFAEAFDDILLLCQEHYDEVALHKDKMELAPSRSHYEKLASAGCLKFYTVRYGGVLVGYSVFLLTNHPHYEKSLVAMNDVLFLSKPYRKGMTGVRFISYCEKQLKAAGVVKVVWHVKVEHNFGAILKRLGYAPEDVMWGKCLDEER